MIRLRQVALVARDLDAAVGELCERLGLSVCFRDPGVGAFGLHNALMTIGEGTSDVMRRLWAAWAAVRAERAATGMTLTALRVDAREVTAGDGSRQPTLFPVLQATVDMLNRLRALAKSVPVARSG